MAVDTLAYAETLVDGGIEEKQAKAIVHGLTEHVLPDLATTTDILRLEQKMTELHLNMTIRIYTGLVGAVALTVTLIKVI